MNSGRYFFWLIEQAFDGFLYAWPVSLAVTAIFIIALFFNNPFSKKNYRKSRLLVFAPFLITVAILFVGTIMRHEGVNSPSIWPQYVVFALALLHLPLAAFLIYYFKNFRWFEVCANVFQMWCSWWVYFVALMSVSGDWL
jgi:hypothetical protein